MGYYNYHATAKRLIAENRLTEWFFTKSYHGISPALILLFDSPVHPVMPIREAHFPEYLALLPEEKKRKMPENGSDNRE